MKITCTKCGKRFDAEDHLYICPKCNHYHSQVGAHNRSGNTVSVDDEPEFIRRLSRETVSDDDKPEFIQTLNGEQRVYTAKKKTEEKNSDAFLDTSSIFKKIVLAICIIVGFITVISSTIGEFDEWSGDDNSWSDDWGKVYSEEQVEYGDPMCFETFTVNVGDVGEPEFDGLKAENGYKLVQVNFTTDSTYDYQDESILTDVQAKYDTPNHAGNTYALYEDEITDDASLEGLLYDKGLVTEAHYSGSYFFIFEIPEEADQFTLAIDSFVPENGAGSGSYVQDESFCMPIDL